MAKRSQRRRLRQERDQAGCIWGLISMFDFRHGRTTKRLLSDRRRMSKQQAVGAGNSRNQAIILKLTEKCESIVDDEESKMRSTDVAKTSVKELMEEEMIHEQGPENQSMDSEISLERSNSDYKTHPKTHHKKRDRSRIKSGDVDVSELDNLDLEKIMEELAQMIHRSSDLDLPSDQSTTAVEEKLVTAIKIFTEQRLSSSKRFGEDCCSKEFMDALQTLSSNKGLFLKLLQDPNSKLVKHVQDLQDAQLGKDLPPNLPVNVKVDERKQRNFFRRRSKSMECFPVGAEKDFESANKIVILKPGPAGIRSPGSNSMDSLQPNNDKVHNERNPSQFSFTEIKRKLRHAMGKERQGVSPDRLALKYSPNYQNGNNGEKSSKGEDIRNRKFTERFLMSSPSFKKVENVKDANETCPNPRFGGANLYIEARKHLSEMLKNGDENSESMNGQMSKSLGRILSLPEYKGSPSCSPRKFGDDIFITEQMRLSPRGVVRSDMSGALQENQYNLRSPRRSVSLPAISISNSEDKDTSGSFPLRDDQKCSSEIQSFTGDTIVTEAIPSSPSVVVEIEEMIEATPQEEDNIVGSSSKSSNNLICGDIEKEDAVEVDETEVPSQFLDESSACFQSSLFGEDQMLSSPAVSPARHPVSSEMEDSDCAIDKMERPSPISVLEPLFTDDDISPASSISHSVEKEIQPRHIHFEEQSSASDQGICTRISLEDEESAFEYVEAVLLGSGLNWDDFLLRWLSTYEILDPSLFDEVELFSSRPRHDQKLLFDCANEALTEVCETYFACFTGISYFKPSIQTPPKGMELIHEIWRRVEQLLVRYPQPHSLDQLVKTDLARSRKWMNLQSDVEFIVFEMEDAIFVDLVDEFFESECSVVLSEPNPDFCSHLTELVSN